MGAFPIAVDELERDEFSNKAWQLSRISNEPPLA
jgi:hypothetical protein